MVIKSKPVKILFVHQNLNTGGAELLRKYTMPYFDNSRYDIDICCIEEKGKIGERLERKGYKVISLQRKINVKNSIAIFWKIFSLISKNRYDIIQSSLFYANFFSRLAGIFTGACLISEEHGIDKWKLKYPFLIWIDRFLSRFTYKIICCSECVKNFIVSHEAIPEDKIVVMKNCLNFKYFNVSETKEELRERYSFKNQEIILGVIAILKQEKGLNYLIKAAANLIAKYRNIRVLIIGDGPLLADLQKLASDLDINARVTFMGLRRDTPQLLKIMDLFIMPSVSEGLGLSILEAMYMGVPVVAADTGGIAEIINDNENGLLFIPMDVEKLETAIEKLILNKTLYNRISKKAKEFVIDNFDAENYVKKLENIYAQSLA